MGKRLCTEFPGQTQPLALFWGGVREPRAVLSSSATVRKVDGWATKLLVCSGELPWLDRLKAVFSNGWGYELLFLPRQSGGNWFQRWRASVCGLDSNWPAPQVSWLNNAIGFILWMIGSAYCTPFLSTAGRATQLPGGLASLPDQVGAR